MKPATTICPKCGQAIPPDAPAGLCPRCLVAGGLSATNPGQPASPASPAKVSSVDPGATLHIVIPENTALPPGAPRKLGDYELIEEIARGGMGIVYKAWQPGLERFVAVKTIRSGLLATSADVERFQREAKAAAKLHHPNIVGIHEIGEQDGQHYFAMDYVPGQSLATIARTQPFLPEQAAQITAAIAEAIHYAHGQGVLHRDLKPANVILGPDGPRVLDFGLARVVTDDSQLTQSGAPMGSPSYMPPEQAAGKTRTLDARADGTGAMLYELLTGRPPFQAATVMETLRLVQETEPVTLRRINPSLPADLETICLKCLEKEPAKRYQTAEALADELGRFQRDEPIHARPVRAPEKVWRWCRRKPALSGSLAAAFTLLLVVAIGAPIAAFRINRERQRAENEARRAEVEALIARQRAYSTDINLAQQALVVNNFGRAQELLDRNRPVGSRGNEAQTRSATKGSQSLLTSAATQDLRGWEWRYLWQQCQSDALFTLCQATNEIGSLAVSHDGKWLAIGEDGGLSIWDLQTRREIARLPAAGWGDVLAAFSPRERLLAFSVASLQSSTNWQFSIRLWNGDTREIVGDLPVQGYCMGLAFSGDGRTLVTSTAGEQGQIALWRMPDDKKLASYPAARAGWIEGTPFAMAQDMSVAAHAAAGGKVRVIDLANGHERWSTKGSRNNNMI